ncbi:hypothetical protein HEK616_83680 (plasmid) [Streptomyces nigrescens]|uniref:Transposase n=1 Tax=Streptomyces nigrescens TaxID=1920 RepID=A0ABM8A8A3_STRNI|nr:hypothetical protein HEK616_83680 [Streptomyces nigrescens]
MLLAAAERASPGAQRTDSKALGTGLLILCSRLRSRERSEGDRRLEAQRRAGKALAPIRIHRKFPRRKTRSERSAELIPSHTRGVSLVQPAQCTTRAEDRSLEAAQLLYPSSAGG